MQFRGGLFSAAMCSFWWFNSWPFIPDRWVGHLSNLWFRVTFSHTILKKVKEKLPGKLFLQKPCNRPGPSIMTRWWFQTFFIFTPNLGEDLSTLINIFQMGRLKPPTSYGNFQEDLKHSWWFNVTFSYPSWRLLSLWKGHLTIPKRSLWITWLWFLLGCIFSQGKRALIGYEWPMRRRDGCLPRAKVFGWKVFGICWFLSKATSHPSPPRMVL